MVAQKLPGLEDDRFLRTTAGRYRSVGLNRRLGVSADSGPGPGPCKKRATRDRDFGWMTRGTATMRSLVGVMDCVFGVHRGSRTVGDGLVWFFCEWLWMWMYRVMREVL